MNDSGSTLGRDRLAPGTAPTETDPEMEAWADAWRVPVPETGRDGEAAIPRDLRRRVRRRGRVLVAMTVCDVAVTLGALVGLGRLTPVLTAPIDRLLLATLSALALSALAFSLWNRWGTWRPSTESTAAYLELSLLRCQRRLRSVRAGWVVLAVECALFLPWVGHRLRLHSGGAREQAWLAGPLAAYGFLALVVAVAAAFLLVLGARARREQRELEALRRDLSEEG